MTEKPTSDGGLTESLRRLGTNLRNLAEDAWNSEERQTFAREIEESISEIGAALDNAARDVVEHPEVQRLREEINEFSERLRSGEFAAELKQEVQDAIDEINTRVENIHFESREEEVPPASGEETE